MLVGGFWGGSVMVLDGSGVVLGWFWGGSGMVLGWFWDGSAVVLGGFRGGVVMVSDCFG